MKVIAMLIVCWLCLGTPAGAAQDRHPAQPPADTEPATASRPAAAPVSAKGPAKVKLPQPVAGDNQTREPFKITREFEAQMEEVEPPEIEVTGVFKAKGKTVAMAKLQLDKVEGRVALHPGMRVSIPKPDRENSESERWMTYFTVREISPTGMVIVLENGETVWYPVMGKLD